MSKQTNSNEIQSKHAEMLIKREDERNQPKSYYHC